jgi:hypothetical protein
MTKSIDENSSCSYIERETRTRISIDDDILRAGENRPIAMREPAELA